MIRALPLAALLAAVAAPASAAGPSAAGPSAAPSARPAPPAALAPAAQAAAGRVLSLEEALAIGRARQPQLQQARATSEAARARVDQALAPLLPQVSGTARYQHDTSNTGRTFGLTGSTPGARDSDLYSLGLTGNLLVWDFGQTWGRWRAARASAAGQSESERATAQSVDLGIRSTYFNAVAARALLGVARDTLANEERHLEQTRAFVEIGTRPPIDLVQERANVANARVRLIQAENGYDTARVQVEQAIGATDLGPWDVAETGLPPVPGEEAALDVLLPEAVAARPDIAALGDQLRAQELTVRAYQGGYGPSLGVSAGITEAGPRPDDLQSGWNTAVTLTWPLFQGGQTRGQVREARANVSGLQAQLEQLRQSVRVEVEQARLGVRAAVATLAAAEEASQAARERLGLAEGRYETGVGSLLDLSDAQLALTTALGQQVQAQFQLAVARSQLLKSLGRP